MKLAIVGVTGLVGQEILKILEEFNFPINTLIPIASEKSKGKEIEFNGETYTIVTPEIAINLQPDVALFSAGGEISLEWAQKFADIGCRVIDNSSAFRMDNNKKLIVPEINADLLTTDDYIIANPNCSTIQMVLALAPLHQLYTIKRVVVSTYQSISGSGSKAISQMENERKKIKKDMVYPYPIDQNILPHCDDFLENGYTKEEMKLVNETHKILDPNIAVTATAARVPVQGGHSESINVSFEKDFDLIHIRKLFYHTPGIHVKDNPDTNTYPMPLLAQGKNDVFVGRLRRDESQDNTLNMWVVADNLRKGAALNAIQIVMALVNKDLIDTDADSSRKIKQMLKRDISLSQLQKYQARI